jgi:hypothetical protein
MPLPKVPEPAPECAPDEAPEPEPDVEPLAMPLPELAPEPAPDAEPAELPLPALPAKPARRQPKTSHEPKPRSGRPHEPQAHRSPPRRRSHLARAMSQHAVLVVIALSRPRDAELGRSMSHVVPASGRDAMTVGPRRTREMPRAIRRAGFLYGEHGACSCSGEWRRGRHTLWADRSWRGPSRLRLLAARRLPRVAPTTPCATSMMPHSVARSSSPRS